MGSEVKPIGNEELAKIKEDSNDVKNILGVDPGEIEPSRIDRLIARIEADQEFIDKFIDIAGADKDNIDGAICKLRERQRQIGLQSNELGQLRKRVGELEAEVQKRDDELFKAGKHIGELSKEVEKLCEIEQKYNSGKITTLELVRVANVHFIHLNDTLDRFIDDSSMSCRVRVIKENSKENETNDE